MSGEFPARNWESFYLANDTPWDKGCAHPALVSWLARHRLTGRILVPGCGSGHDVRALSGDADARVTGLDLAPSAKRVAESFPRAGHEIYLTGDFLSGAPADAGSFDSLFEHTCFCAIPPDRRPAYARAVAGQLRPGGLFLAIFYRNPSHGGEDGPPFGCTMEEVGGLFGGKFSLLEESTPIATFPGRENREVLQLWVKVRTGEI
jgi:SAM-dependent methyltransferase